MNLERAHEFADQAKLLGNTWTHATDPSLSNIAEAAITLSDHIGELNRLVNANKAEIKRLEGMVNAALDEREGMRELWNSEIIKRGKAEDDIKEWEKEVNDLSEKRVEWMERAKKAEAEVEQLKEATLFPQ